MTFQPYIRRQLNSSVSVPLTVRQVAQAYNFPKGVTGRGFTVGLIELGGGFHAGDFPGVTSVPVAGGENRPDGPNGYDGEVQADIEVVQQVAPGAGIRVYFGPNTNEGFLAVFTKAIAECDIVSCSYGLAEALWSASVMDAFDREFAVGRQNGCIIFCAAGDSGSKDSTSYTTVDFPASSPNVIGCGGTRLELAADGMRASETTWNDNPASSATGGGVSKHFPGRQVPDIAGNADPQTGYEITVDGQRDVIGGTSLVAPLNAGLCALLSEALGAPLGSKVDLMNTILTNLGICYDVTAGDNGGYRAGPGRDDVTGFGVIDGTKLLEVLTSGNQLPAPVPTPGPSPTPVTRTFPNQDTFDTIDTWARKAHHGPTTKPVAVAWNSGS